MAIITRGSFQQISALVGKAEEARREVGEAPMPMAGGMDLYPTSDSPRGIALKSIRILEGFEGIENIFDPDNDIYFVSWAWDFSGNPPMQYPGVGLSTNDGTANCLIPMKVGRQREFGGSGIVLFPARRISAGLGVRIMVWESDQEKRDFGKTMLKVTKVIEQSELSSLLAGIAAGTTAGTVAVIYKASVELSKLVGQILEDNENDYVEFFEGYYPVSEPWKQGIEQQRGQSAEIVLTHLV